MAVSRTSVVFLVASVLLIGFAIGFLVGYIGLKGDNHGIAEPLTKDADESITQKLLQEINAENIRENLRDLTSKPHLAGTPADFEQANQLKTLWEEQGLKSWLTSYDVLLSYPDKDVEPSRIELLDESGSVSFTSQLYEKIVRPEQNHPDVVPPYNSYSAAGNPKGELIYVNYGRIQDFTWLQEDKSMNFTGMICIARYGKIFRGDKATNAEKCGAAGLILYSDPEDYAVENADDVYPDTWWLPSTGVQRGSIQMLGDPLTPGYPAINSAYRIPEDEAGLHTIPVHPISYGDAYHLLKNMGGETAPDNWQGDLNMTYQLGPGFENNQWSVQMHINTKTKYVTTYNAFGMIEGEVEPDRYVLLGNHRDSWVFGAVDPSSGTASMMELARVLGKLRKEGWKPRRSIIFCSWGAEEHGLVGSREWVEQYSSLLSDRAVAYLNVDIAVQGNFSLRAKGLPIIKDTLYEVGQKIPNPDPDEVAAGRATIYDTWKMRYPELDESNQPTGYPKVSQIKHTPPPKWCILAVVSRRIPILGSGSDFEPFITKVGVTCVDLRYHYDESLGISSYPLYHSVYETFHLVNDIMDPDFVYHKAVTQFWGELARKLADDYIIPYDATKYVDSLIGFKDQILSRYGTLLEQKGLKKSLDYLEDAVLAIKIAANAFHKRLHSVDKHNPVAVRMMNDQLMRLERAFVDPQGLPGRPFTRNVVFAPSAHDSYSGSSFPGIVDSLFEIEKVSGDTAKERWNEVAKQLSVVTFYIQSAAITLNEWTDFNFE